MATRQKDKDKDIINFFKKLKKRYSVDADLQSRERKILEHVVFATYLENAPFKSACSCFNKLERYFIDWNEVRVSKANEIAVVVGSVPNALKASDRLRRFLQWIFNKTFKFDLEDVRAKGVEETLSYLESVPFSTRFMNEYACLFGFGEPVLPMDEGILRVFRLLGWVEVCDDKETVPCLDGVFKGTELKEFFFVVHELGCELTDESTQKAAIKFLATIDPEASKRSFEPLVESSVPTDPSEIAKLYAKRERPSKPFSTSAMMNEMFGDGAMDSDDMDESDDFEKEGFEKGGEEGEIDSFKSESSDDFASDGLSGRRGGYDPAYGAGKRAETTLTKDGASYSESVSESVGSNDYETSRFARSERVAKPRRRVKDVENESESSQKSRKSAGSVRSTKESERANSEENVADDLVVARSSDEKKSNEKKASEKKPCEKKSSEKKPGEKKLSASDDEVAKNAEVKKASRVSKSKKASDNSESVEESTTEATEKKKSVSSVRNVSEKKSVDEGVKKEKKTSSKATKESTKESAKEPAKESVKESVKESSSKSKNPSVVSNVESSKKRVKEQEVVDDGASKTKRRRESEAPKVDPPLSRSKKR